MSTPTAEHQDTARRLFFREGNQVTLIMPDGLGGLSQVELPPCSSEVEAKALCADLEWLLSSLLSGWRP